MNKNLHLILALLFVSTLQSLTAQSTFKLTQTGYVGALRPETSNDWTKGWTNFDPKNAVYGAVTDTLTLNGMHCSC